MKKNRRKKKKHIVDGIEFDSKTESVHYKMLKEHPKVKIKHLQKTFMLMDSMPYTKLPEYVERKQRKMVYTPDFIIEVEGRNKPIAMETKGHARGEYKMRKKLFINKYGNEYDFYECKDKSDGRVLAKELPILVGDESG